MSLKASPRMTIRVSRARSRRFESSQRVVVAGAVACAVVGAVVGAAIVE